jgi:hypothetical protein
MRVGDRSSVANIPAGIGHLDHNHGNTTMVLTTPSCASVALAAVPTTQAAGANTAVVFTATAGTCTHSTGQLYEFWYRGQGSTTWQLVKGYSTSNTYSWNTTGALAGNHYWSVWIKDSGSSGTTAAMGSTYDAFGPLTFVMT